MFISIAYLSSLKQFVCLLFSWATKLYLRLTYASLSLKYYYYYTLFCCFLSDAAVACLQQPGNSRGTRKTIPDKLHWLPIHYIIRFY